MKMIKWKNIIIALIFISSITFILVDLLKIDADKINIKANTNEGMDAIGKGLAIACYANVLIYK